MTQSQAIERLMNLVDFAKESMPRYINGIRMGRSVNLTLAFEGLASLHKILAMHARYIKKDDGQFRQQMYIASRLLLQAFRFDDGRAPFETGAELLCALLSDDESTIDQMSRVRPKYYARHFRDPSNPQFMVRMWQLAIRGDDRELLRSIELVSSHGPEPCRSRSQRKEDFFSLLLLGDKNGLESRILADASIAASNPIFSEFFSFIGTLEAKLCWYRDIHVAVKSHSIPVELLPVQPLRRYDDTYEFMRTDWMPPKLSIFSRISKLFRSG